MIRLKDLLKDLLTEGNARVSIHTAVYRGKDGFAIYGRDTYGRKVSIFAKNRKSAEHIRDKVKAGEEIGVKDFEETIDLTEAVDAKFEKAAKTFLTKSQKLIDAHMKMAGAASPRKILSFSKGKRYWRIWAEYKGDKMSRSAWAFLDTTNGDVLKPASWRAPAKHARGNIYDTQGGMKDVGPYGPAYMR